MKIQNSTSSGSSHRRFQLLLELRYGSFKNILRITTQMLDLDKNYQKGHISAFDNAEIVNERCLKSPNSIFLREATRFSENKCWVSKISKNI